MNIYEQPVEDIYVVEIGFDYDNKWKRFSNLPPQYIKTHEFTQYKDLDSYIKYAEEVSADGLGKFFYKISKIPVKYSKKYKRFANGG